MMEYSSEDIAMLVKKYSIMAISCYYNDCGRLITKLYCKNNGQILVDTKPSKVINVICEMYNNSSYSECVEKTKKIIVCDKKVPVYINDKFGSVWLPFATTSNDSDSCFWLNMYFISLNPHTFIVNRKNKNIKLILEDGQIIETKIKYKNFIYKWGIGASLKYELNKIRNRLSVNDLPNNYSLI